jgi:hypothetical protein
MRGFGLLLKDRPSRKTSALSLSLTALTLLFVYEGQSEQARALNASDFALEPSPASLTVYAGTASEATIHVTGDPDQVADAQFAVTSPLPSGVTALFTRDADGSGLLTLIAARDAALGPAAVTVAGTSHGITATTTIALAVNAPTFLLSISPVPFSIAAGSTAASTVTVVPWGGFTGTVNLSGYQLPSGVHATFSQPTTTTSTDLTWTADASAPSGSSAAIIAGNAPGMTSYSQFQQIVTAAPAPSFTVGVSPAYLTINQGATATDNVAVVESNGFSGNVNLSVTQLPGGISAALSPDTTNGKSNLTLSATNTAAVGMHVISVWGTAPGLSALSPLYLTVQPSLEFTLATSARSLRLVHGASSSTTIVISRDSEFRGVGLSIASALPNGISASLTPQAGTANYDLTLTASAAVAPSTYFVNLCGSSGDQNITITIPVEVGSAIVTAAPPPSIESMSPAFTSAAGPAFTLALSGSGFTQGSTVNWGASALPTQFVNSTALAAQVSAGNIATAGLAAVTVQTQPPGGGASNIVQFEVDSLSSSPAVAPAFSTPAAIVSAGQTAAYPVTLPATATDISATCLNLPSGASCVYANNELNIQTSSTSPVGTYQVTVVFSETLPVLPFQALVLPLFAMPLAFRRGRSKWWWQSLTLLFALGFAFSVVFAAGCGKGTSMSQTTAATKSTQITTSAVVTLTVR